MMLFLRVCIEIPVRLANHDRFNGNCYYCLAVANLLDTTSLIYVDCFFVTIYVPADSLPAEI